MVAGVPWRIEEGGGPLVACAVHAGNEVRAEALRHMAIRRRERFIEEDPFTDQLATVARTYADLIREGVLEAAFDGRHGWFWRNRIKGAVTVTLRTDGDYQDIKRVL